MKRISIYLFFFGCLDFAWPVFAQNNNTMHELYPTLGIYAPDRFETSISYGLRYDYHFSQRMAFGASIGFAQAKQDFFDQSAVPRTEAGGDRIIYYNGRIARDYHIGSVVTYGVLGFGITRQHSEANLTISTGIGSKIPLKGNTFLRYEINNHFFNSGQNNSSWFNKSLEFTIGISFFLEPGNR